MNRIPGNLRWFVALAAALVFSIVAAGEHPVRLEGDSLEYIVQTQALVLDGSISIRPAERAEYWNRTAPYPDRLGSVREDGSAAERAPAGGGFGGLYPNLRGGYSYYHFFTYPLVVAPVYAMLHVAVPGTREYGAFFIVNCALYGIALFSLLARSRSLAGRLSVFFLLTSPLSAYIRWAQPEVMLFSFTVLAFTLRDGARSKYFAPLLLGVAATQAPPIALFLPVHCYLALRDDTRAWIRVTARYVPAVLVTALPILHSLGVFGVPNPIEAFGFASFEYTSFERVAHVLFSPMVGASWFLPVGVLTLPIALALRETRSRALFIAASTVAVLYLACATSNFNSAQIGCLRYALWALAPLLVLAVEIPPRLRASLVALALSALVVYVEGSYRLWWGEDDSFRNGERAGLPATRIYRNTEYSEEPETFVENLRRSELHLPAEFNGIYVLRLGGRKRFWLVTRRALERLSYCSWKREEPFEWRSSPRFEILRRSDSRIGFVPGTPPVEFRHPVFGGYILLRTKGALADFRCDAPYFER